MHAVNELLRNSPLLRGGKKAAQLSGAEDACQFDSGRGAPSACKFFILDVSDIAKELGLPTCNEVSRSLKHVEYRARQGRSPSCVGSTSTVMPDTVPNLVMKRIKGMTWLILG